MPNDKKPNPKPTKTPPNLAAAPKTSTPASPLEGPVVAKPVHRKQGELPGTERAVIPEIETKLVVYLRDRDQSVLLQRKVREHKAELIGLYEKHGIEHHPLIDDGVEYDGKFKITKTFELNKVTEDD